MKKTISLMIMICSFSSLILLSSCAAGAATAGYALKAQSADSLTADAEQRIVNRTKREIMAELTAQPSCPVVCQPTQ